jgi:ferredoxin
MDFTGVEAEAAALADGPGLSLMVACPQAFAGLARRGISLDGDRWRVLEVSSPGSLRPLEVLRLRGLGFQRVIGVGLDDCCPDPPGAFLVVTALLKRLGMGGVVDYWDLAKGESPELWDNACVGTSTELPRATSLQELAKVLAPPEGGLIPLPGRGGGIMELDPSACTLCMVCAERCPSKALALESLGPGLIRLTFDHRACDGCVLCERVCPEHAITMRRAIDPAATFEPRILKEDSWTLCASCSVPVAPMSMVAQVQARLGSPVALDLCPDCKPTRGLPVQGLGIPQSASEKTK